MKNSTASSLGFSTTTHSLLLPEQWNQSLHNNSAELYQIQGELLELCGINEFQSIENIIDTYVPLTHLLIQYSIHHEQLSRKTQALMPHQSEITPFIISITGSVAVGKSTTSRIIKKLLSLYYPDKKIGIINTDGFLFRNQTLRKKQLLSKKGFPESYNQKLMLRALIDIKNKRKRITLPLYSHEHYDIVANGQQMINNPDILLLEGLNLIDSSPLDCISTIPNTLRHFINFSIYVNASNQHIKKWYIKRFMTFRDQAKDYSYRYFHRFTKLSDEQAIKYAGSIWDTINEPNLNTNILPFKYNADLILNKDARHSVESIELKKI